jgi:hypothetical protein
MKIEKWMIVAANAINTAFAEGKIKTINDTAQIIQQYQAQRDAIDKTAQNFAEVEG